MFRTEEVTLKKIGVENLLDKIGRSLDEKGGFSYHNELRSVSDILSLFPVNGEGQTVLDIDINRGFRAIPLSYMNYSVFGIESSWKTIRRFENQFYKPYSIQVKKCDITCDEFPFSDSQFDWVVLADISIEHNPLDVHVLSEIRRVAKPDARFILQIPNVSSLQRRFMPVSEKSGTRMLNRLRRNAVINPQPADKNTIKGLINLIEKYGFREVLRLYRNSNSVTGTRVPYSVQRLAGFFFPHLRDTIIIVCKRR